MGKLLILAGVFLILCGIVILLVPYVPPIGRLPGDIHLKGKTVNFYFPLTTCILLSILLTIILNLFLKR